MHVCGGVAISPNLFEGTRLLGLTDGVSVALAVFQLAFSAVVSIVLWRLGAWQRRYEGMEQKLQETAARLVDERLRAAAQEVAAHVHGLVAALDDLKQRVKAGDAEVRAMAERDQRIELALAGRIDALKDYLREHAAGKKDLERHEAGSDRRFTQIEQRLVTLAGTVAVLSERRGA